MKYWLAILGYGPTFNILFIIRSLSGKRLLSATMLNFGVVKLGYLIKYEVEIVYVVFLQQLYLKNHAISHKGPSIIKTSCLIFYELAKFRDTFDCYIYLNIC